MHSLAFEDAARVRGTYHTQLWVDVWQAQDPWIYASLDIPRSTRLYWRDTPPPEIVGAELFDRGDIELRRENDVLKHRVALLVAIARLLFTLVRVRRADLRHCRVPDPRVGPREQPAGTEAATM